MKSTSAVPKSARNYFGTGTYLGLAGALLAMIVLFSSLSDHFFSYDTLSTLANQIPDLMVLSVGMTFVLIIGGIDLSVGSVLALAASAVSVAILGWGWGSFLRPCWEWHALRWQVRSRGRSASPGGFLPLLFLWVCWRWPGARPIR